MILSPFIWPLKWYPHQFLAKNMTWHQPTINGHDDFAIPNFTHNSQFPTWTWTHMPAHLCGTFRCLCCVYLQCHRLAPCFWSTAVIPLSSRLYLRHTVNAFQLQAESMTPTVVMNVKIYLFLCLHYTPHFPAIIWGCSRNIDDTCKSPYLFRHPHVARFPASLLPSSPALELAALQRVITTSQVTSKNIRIQVSIYEWSHIRTQGCQCLWQFCFPMPPLHERL